ncbi:MAG: AAA family ATPase [Blastocatellia bacterium]
MDIVLPDPSLVLLIGVAGSGKSTFARRHFAPTEIVSSDHCRALVCDDENNQAVNQDAFALVHSIAAKRLAHGKLTVIDATNVQDKARRFFRRLAAVREVPLVAIVFDFSLEVALVQNAQRQHRSVPPEIIQEQQTALQEMLSALVEEEFQAIHVLTSPAKVAALTIQRKKVYPDQSD